MCVGCSGRKKGLNLPFLKASLGLVHFIPPQISRIESRTRVEPVTECASPMTALTLEAKLAAVHMLNTLPIHQELGQEARTLCTLRWSTHEWVTLQSLSNSPWPF